MNYKGVRSHDLNKIKSHVKLHREKSFTMSSIRDIGDLDLTMNEAIDLICELTVKQNFYKSMTTYSNSAIWQDVYHTELSDGTQLYIKFTLHDDRVITVISFKRRD